VSALDYINEIKFEWIGKYLIAKLPDYKSRIGLYPYKKELLQFKTPNILKGYIGKTINLYKNMLDPMDGELFRIEPINFEIGSADVPWFDCKNFSIPIGYVNKYLDERCENLRAVFSRNSEAELNKKLLYVYLSEENLPHSCIMTKRGNMLRGGNLKHVLGLLEVKGLNIKRFIYSHTTEKTIVYKYGIMTFEYVEDTNG
jgi:hypothetical protein